MAVAHPEPVFAEPFEAPETRTYLDLLRTHGSVTTRSADLYRRHGVTEQQYHVLQMLAQGPEEGLCCLDIARLLPTPAPDVTRLVDRMRRAGLVQRRRLERDRRVVMIELTAHGRRVAARVGPEVADFHRARLAHLSHAELETLTLLLRKVRGPDA